MRFAIYGLTVVLGVQAAYADPSLECGMDNGSQVEIAECVNTAADRVDAAIDVAYGFAAEAAKSLDEITERDVALPALEASQAAWSAYRDAQCDFVGASFGGGSGTGIGISSCRVELGRARVTALLNMAE